MKILVFTENTDPTICLQIMTAGANGFVLKSSSISELSGAIEKVLSGKEFISLPLVSGVSQEKELEKQKRQQLASLALSSRENQVAHELLNGAVNKEIATKLNVSHKMVKYYMNQIMRKLDARNRVEVVLELQRMIGKGPI